MRPLTLVLTTLLILQSAFLFAFSGLKQALPAPRAAVLMWDRESGDNKRGSIKYVVYTKEASGWKQVDEVSGTEWVITDLQPGRDYEFMVRAKKSGSEDNNTKSMKVRPTSAFPEEEWRAVWVNRFDWPGGNLQTIRSRVSSMMETLAAANMNAVILQVRGQGDTLYPSDFEPWSPMVAAAARSGDPVAIALEEAGKNKIQVHAWINLSVIWQSGSNSLPSDPNHPLFKFADARSADKRLGLIHDASGKPKQWGADDYVWLTHGNPEVNTYLRRQVLHFLQKYDVDGIHIDDRTGNPNGVSRDPVSVHRYEGRGNPMGIKDFEKWQQDQLSRFLSDLYVLIKAKDHSLLVSAGPFGIAERKRISGYGSFSDCHQFGVEPEKWLEMGVVDVLMPQMYWDMPDPEPNYGTLVMDWMKHNRSGRPIWPGSALGKYGGEQPLDPMQIKYVAMTRALGLNGNTFYKYQSAQPAQWRAIAPRLYPNKARVPVPDHMNPSSPQITGQIMGVVKDRSGSPEMDAWIAIGGTKYIYLSSADGYFGIPNLKPGKYTVHFSRRSDERVTKDVIVKGGETTNLEGVMP